MKSYASVATWLALAALTTACADVLQPSARPPEPGSAQRIDCSASTAAPRLRCVRVAPAGGARANLILGGQDELLRLISSAVSYDGVGEFRADVELMNLLYQPMGTADGTTVYGAKVFFMYGPTTTAGTGTVTLANPDGTGTFLASNQPYFHYNQIIAPRGTSVPKSWRFNVPPTVQTFAFTVYVETKLQQESGPLRWLREGGRIDVSYLWAVSPTEVYGGGARPLQFDGQSWGELGSSQPPVGGRIAASGPRQVVILGSGGTLHRFDGVSWTQVRAQTADLETEAIAANGDLFVVAGWRYDAGTSTRRAIFLRSADGGHVWSPVIEYAVGGGMSLTIKDVAISGDTVWAAGGASTGGPGTMLTLKSVDGGQTWTHTIHYGLGASGLYGIAARGDSIYGVGLNESGVGSAVLRSHDGGATWSWRELAGMSARDVWTAPTGEIFVAGGPVAISRNGGTTFDVDTLPDSYSSVSGSSAVDVHVASGAVASRWNGSTWTPTSTGTHPELPQNVDLAGAEVTADGTVYAVGTLGQQGVVLRRSSTWTVLNTTSTAASLGGIWAGGDTLWAVGSKPGGASPLDGGRSAVLRYSTNRGASWAEQVLSGDGLLRGIWGTPGGDTLFAVGAAYDALEQARRGMVLRSTDGGATWTKTSAPTVPFCYELRGVWGQGDHVWVAGPGQMGHSADRGATWSWQAWSAPVGAGVAIWGTGPNDLYATGGTTVYHSTDAGQSWGAVATASQSLVAIRGVSATDVWAAGALGTLLHYDGAAWRSVDLGSWSSAAIAARSTNDVFLFGAGVVHGER